MEPCCVVIITYKFIVIKSLNFSTALSYGWVVTHEQKPKVAGTHCTPLTLTSLSRPAATVTMSPVSLLMVNMLGMGLWGVCERIR